MDPYVASKLLACQPFRVYVMYSMVGKMQLCLTKSVRKTEFHFGEQLYWKLHLAEVLLPTSAQVHSLQLEKKKNKEEKKHTSFDY